MQLHCRSTNYGFTHTALTYSPVNLSSTVVPTVIHTHNIPPPSSLFTTVNSIHWKHTKQRHFICWRHSKTHWLHLWHKTLDTEKWHFSAERRTPPHHQNPHWHPRRPPMALCCLTLSEYRCLCEDKDGVFSTCSMVISFKVSIQV